MVDLLFGVIFLDVSFSEVFDLKTRNSWTITLMKFSNGLMWLSTSGLWPLLVESRVIDEESFDWRRRPIALREEIVEIAHCCFFWSYYNDWLQNSSNLRIKWIVNIIFSSFCSIRRFISGPFRSSARASSFTIKFSWVLPSLTLSSARSIDGTSVARLLLLYFIAKTRLRAV